MDKYKGLLKAPATHETFLKQLKDTHSKITKDILKIDAHTMHQMMKSKSSNVKSRDELIRAFQKIYFG